MSTPSRKDDASLAELLRTSFGFESFRPYQREIVEAVASNRDVFAALPTGGGKSLCYQLPALLRPGLTVVVSPLISLMKDQVDAARANGLRAAFLNSTLSAEESRETWRQLASGNLTLLYVSPERLSIPDFRDALRRFRLSFVAVDEAHCISEWGHEFRPDYRTLSSIRSEFPDVPIAAFTATATRSVQQDIVRLLHLNHPFVVRASFNRPEIFYRVREKTSDVDRQIHEFIASHPGEPGIVYRSTRKAVEKTARYLADHGVNAVAYHAGLSDDVRRRCQEAFVRDERTVVVATIAFGLGIDKSNVRWVVHGDLPRSLEGYYQETGRAARDGDPADTVLFHGPGDLASIRWHIGKLEDDDERRRAELRLDDVIRFVKSTECRRRVLLSHFDEEFAGGCGRCDVCAGEVAMEDRTIDAQKILSASVRTGERFGAHHLADILVGNLTDKVLERGHNHLPTFAVGSDLDRSYWLSLVGDLASAGFLVRGEGKTAGFHLSHRGRMLLKGKDTFVVSRRAAPQGDGGPTGRPDNNRPAGDEGTGEFARADQSDLFDCLKRLRMRLAREQNVPPYVIFSDRTLRIMARNRPVDEPALLRCSGVGEHKLRRYGVDFLRVIRAFLEDGECRSM